MYKKIVLTSIKYLNLEKKNKIKKLIWRVNRTCLIDKAFESTIEKSKANKQIFFKLVLQFFFYVYSAYTMHNYRKMEKGRGYYVIYYSYAGLGKMF